MDDEKNIDTALLSIVIIAKLNNLYADPNQLKHILAIEKNGMTEIEMLRAAKKIGLRSRKRSMTYEKLLKLNFPVILKLKESIYVVAIKSENEDIVLLNPSNAAPETISKEKILKLWDGTVFLFSTNNIERKEIIFGLKWFIPAIFKYKRSLSEVLLASFTMQIIGLATPIAMQVIIDKVLVHKGISMLNALGIGLLIVILFESVLHIARTYIFTNVTSKIDVVLGAKIFKHLFSLPLRYFETRRVGDTIARVRQVENIRSFLTGTPLTTILDLMFVVVYVLVMLYYSKTLTFIVLGSIPFFIVLSLIVNPMYRKRLEEKFKCGAETNSYLVENVTGVQTVKAFALEPQSQKKWEKMLARHVKSGFKLSALTGISGGIGQFIQRTTDLLILWFGAQLVISGHITIGALIAFRMLSGRVSGPILSMVQMWQSFQQVGVSVRKLSDIFKTTPEPSMDSTKVQLPSILGKIEVYGLRFRYKAGTPEVLRNVSFEISSGTMIGIVGRSGSGKSTLSKILQRLYIPESGKILIDGIDISLADPAWLRRQIGVVLQENFLFNGTIRENVCVHTQMSSMEEIINVCKIAGAHEFITEFPEGYNTMVGERGSSLSGGQRQRIAIARALITNPKILIFDEATSALDYESERIIQENLDKICTGRTVIIIAHRLSTLRNADKIMAFEKGELVEYDTHENLLIADGIYANLYKQQERSA